jgi:N-acetyl-S-(2-succino)cysteine monooxygenase
MPLLSASLGGIDLSAYALDEPLPADLPAGNAMTNRRRSILELAAREHLTLLQLAAWVADTRGHWVVA